MIRLKFSFKFDFDQKFSEILMEKLKNIKKFKSQEKQKIKRVKKFKKNRFTGKMNDGVTNFYGFQKKSNLLKEE